jgi:hypothetical protein
LVGPWVDTHQNPVAFGFYRIRKTISEVFRHVGTALIQASWIALEQEIIQELRGFWKDSGSVVGILFFFAKPRR